jgi:hypothetical protein
MTIRLIGCIAAECAVAGTFLLSGENLEKNELGTSATAVDVSLVVMTTALSQSAVTERNGWVVSCLGWKMGIDL